MSDNRGNKPAGQIDDFARALLDKKTEIKLYGEEEVRPGEEMSAIQFLRSAQKEDYPASNIFEETSGSQEVPAQKEDKPLVQKQVPPKVKPAGKTASKSAKPKNTPPNKKNGRKKRKVRKTIWIFLILFLLLTGVLLGGYVYKVLVWDPANAISEEQQSAYDKLVEYADEYEMMSDTEKLEILHLIDTYDALSEKQQISINAYYKEQTGKNFLDLLHELQTVSNDNDETNENYTALKDFFDQWSEMSEGQRYGLVYLKNQYDSLNQTLKNKIDVLIGEKTGSTFNALYSDYTMEVKEPEDGENETTSSTDGTSSQENDTDPVQTPQESQNTAEINQTPSEPAVQQPVLPDYSQQKAEIQSQIQSLQSQIEQLQQYNQSLKDDIDYLTVLGEDASEYQGYISENNAAISALQAQIDGLSQQLQQYQ